MRVMTITRTTILAALAMITALPALAAFERVSMAYEITTNNFTAPAGPNGGIVIRQCDACTFQSIRVTTATSYSVNGEPMTLEKFKDALVSTDKESATLTVLHHLESDTVLRVSATLVRNGAQ